MNNTRDSEIIKDLRSAEKLVKSIAKEARKLKKLLANIKLTESLTPEQDNQKVIVLNFKNSQDNGKATIQDDRKNIRKTPPQ